MSTVTFVDGDGHPIDPLTGQRMLPSSEVPNEVVGGSQLQASTQQVEDVTNEEQINPSPQEETEQNPEAEEEASETAETVPPVVTGIENQTAPISSVQQLPEAVQGGGTGGGIGGVTENGTGSGTGGGAAGGTGGGTGGGAAGGTGGGIGGGTEGGTGDSTGGGTGGGTAGGTEGGTGGGTGGGSGGGIGADTNGSEAGGETGDGATRPTTQVSVTEEDALSTIHEAEEEEEEEGGQGEGEGAGGGGGSVQSPHTHSSSGNQSLCCQRTNPPQKSGEKRTAEETVDTSTKRRRPNPPEEQTGHVSQTLTAIRRIQRFCSMKPFSNASMAMTACENKLKRTVEKQRRGFYQEAIDIWPEIMDHVESISDNLISSHTRLIEHKLFTPDAYNAKNIDYPKKLEENRSSLHLLIDRNESSRQQSEKGKRSAVVQVPKYDRYALSERRINEYEDAISHFVWKSIPNRKGKTDMMDEIKLNMECELEWLSTMTDIDSEHLRNRLRVGIDRLQEYATVVQNFDFQVYGSDRTIFQKELHDLRSQLTNYNLLSTNMHDHKQKQKKMEEILEVYQRMSTIVTDEMRVHSMKICHDEEDAEHIRNRLEMTCARILQIQVEQEEAAKNEALKERCQLITAKVSIDAQEIKESLRRTETVVTQSLTEHLDKEQKEWKEQLTDLIDTRDVSDLLNAEASNVFQCAQKTVYQNLEGLHFVHRASRLELNFVESRPKEASLVGQLRASFYSEMTQLGFIPVDRVITILTENGIVSDSSQLPDLSIVLGGQPVISVYTSLLLYTSLFSPVDQRVVGNWLNDLHPVRVDENEIKLAYEEEDPLLSETLCDLVGSDTLTLRDTVRKLFTLTD